MVECTDITYCSPPRSGYFKVMKQFIPAPLCLIQDGLRIDSNENSINAFTSMMIRLAIDDTHLREGINQELPFDYCCPSVEELIKQRTCQLCGIYHASMKSLKIHFKWCKTYHATSHENSCRKTIIAPIVAPAPIRRSMRPARLVAKRQKEKMLVWKSRSNDKYVDWFNEDEVGIDMDGLELPDMEENNSIPILNLDDHMQNRWENC